MRAGHLGGVLDDLCISFPPILREAKKLAKREKLAPQNKTSRYHQLLAATFPIAGKIFGKIR